MLLFDVSPADPLTICGAVAILAVVVLLAVYVPSRRAARIDPAVALRMD
jgi:putative ABC transport system permease protein